MSTDKINSRAKNEKSKIFLKRKQEKVGTSLIPFAIIENHSDYFIYYEFNEEQKISLPGIEELAKCDHQEK